MWLLAERKGFEPLVPFKAHTISSRACSSTPAPLRVSYIDWRVRLRIQISKAAV